MLGKIIHKELLQLRRDKRMFPILIAAPVLQLLILGYAANFDIADLPAAVCDLDRTAESRGFLNVFFGSGYFVRALDVQGGADLDPALERGRAQIGLVVPRGFGRALGRGEGAKVQVVVNGSDPNSGINGYAFALQAAARYSTAVLVERMAAAGIASIPAVDLRTRIWFNPELKTRHFMVPALSGLILMIISIMLTAMTLVREKETGTIEMLVVTPVKKLSMLAGKLLPYLVIGLVEVGLIALVAVFWFEVPFRGSAGLLVLGSLLFLFNTLGLGLLVSTVSRTQQRAMMVVMFAVMMPFIYLSGFIFPIEAMPKAFQAVSRLIPLTYYLEIVRGLFLKGSGFADLAGALAALAGLGTAVFALSVLRFRKFL
ncbi:MAG TPA: ABC transporter permease [Candidatus Aminicenantes bacterium]|nr:ABC transporter permease [Candidatus Aminicenantes bacterium]